MPFYRYIKYHRSELCDVFAFNLKKKKTWKQTAKTIQIKFLITLFYQPNADLKTNLITIQLQMLTVLLRQKMFSKHYWDRNNYNCIKLFAMTHFRCIQTPSSWTWQWQSNRKIINTRRRSIEEFELMLAIKHKRIAFF